jgi:hypothetical protein
MRTNHFLAAIGRCTKTATSLPAVAFQTSRRSRSRGVWGPRIDGLRRRTQVGQRHLWAMRRADYRRRFGAAQSMFEMRSHHPLLWSGLHMTISSAVTVDATVITSQKSQSSWRICLVRLQPSDAFPKPSWPRAFQFGRFGDDFLSGYNLANNRIRKLYMA